MLFMRMKRAGLSLCASNIQRPCALSIYGTFLAPAERRDSLYSSVFARLIPGNSPPELCPRSERISAKSPSYARKHFLLLPPGRCALELFCILAVYGKTRSLVPHFIHFLSINILKRFSIGYIIESAKPLFI